MQGRNPRFFWSSFAPTEADQKETKARQKGKKNNTKTRQEGKCSEITILSKELAKQFFAFLAVTFRQKLNKPMPPRLLLACR
jgi:hypothetical protein